MARTPAQTWQVSERATRTASARSGRIRRRSGPRQLLTGRDLWRGYGRPSSCWAPACCTVPEWPCPSARSPWPTSSSGARRSRAWRSAASSGATASRRSSVATSATGGEKVMLLSAAAWGAMTAFTPVLAHFSSQPIISLTLGRFLVGLLQGVHYPSLASLCSQKVVESERGFLMSTVGSGSYLGTLVIGGAGSLMLDMYSWESVFYVSGFLALLWAYCMWKYLLKGEGPIITLESLGGGGTQPKMTRRNWLRLFKQPAVCAVIITHLCTASTFFTLLSWLPTYFKETFPDAKGWVFNVIPWLVAIPSSLFSGCLSDHLISQGFDTAVVRKLMQFFSMGVSSIFTLFLCGTNTFPMAVAFVSATMGFTTFSHSGVSVNVQDLAPSCAGALFGVMNTCGAFSGVIMVYFSGYLIEATASWTSVFALISLVNILGLATFLVFAEARRVDIDGLKARYHTIHI
ncbi:solute carrier family 17 member 9b isoform X2 [Denticeps clupeoides]|uniref:solute carrier family 17 member 9b isoform X2 n=1 Tax=Denticeps clupeoides TaxID=299321 RepID=UPI0010A520E9|nr:solute carrier family 17 member 9 isoform X2 [Denticeps clupeoides]